MLDKPGVGQTRCWTNQVLDKSGEIVCNLVMGDHDITCWINEGSR